METMDQTNISTEDYDELKFKESKSIQKALEPNGFSLFTLLTQIYIETVILSTLLYKYNKKLKRQERSILITTRAIYNINQKGFLTSLMTVFNKSFKIRRKIEIEKLSGISVSDSSSEFVIHVADEYDYRYASPGKRDQILMAICKTYYDNVKGLPLRFFFRVCF